MFDLRGVATHGSLVLAIAFVATGKGPSRAQTPEQTTASVVERAGRYVEEYERAFTAIVCEEQQIQKLVRPDGSVHKEIKVPK